MTLSHPQIFAIGLFFVAITAIVLISRRLRFWLAILGMLLIALAAGGPQIILHPARTLIAMVDLSPSTRGATFRDRATLLRRIAELTGDHPTQILAFAGRDHDHYDGHNDDHNHDHDAGQQADHEAGPQADHDANHDADTEAQPLPDMDRLPDLPCDQTTYTPPPADEILLFSDGQFPLPAITVPTYPVIDPNLIAPPDAAVRQLETDGVSAQITVINHGHDRHLTITPAATTQPIIVPRGSYVSPKIEIKGSFPFSRFSEKIGIKGSFPFSQFSEKGNDPFILKSATVEVFEAALDGGDFWPENDRLSEDISPAREFLRLWVGRDAAPSGWVGMKPIDLPSDPRAYLSFTAIAISDVSGDDFSPSQQTLLTQYCRDLGGSLCILGNDLRGSDLQGSDLRGSDLRGSDLRGNDVDTLSPLAGHPPAPITRWMLLIDSSGSMAEQSAGKSRWTAATDAVIRLLPFLPAADMVSIGSFSHDLSWWIDGQASTVAAKLTAAPANVSPNGPTNLQAALSSIAARADSLPTELILLTDADATIDDPSGLAAKLVRAKVRVSLLALENVKPDNPLVQIVSATGGHLSTTDDPTRWIESLKQLMQSESPSRTEHSKLQIHFDDMLKLPDRMIDSWKHSWLKQGARLLGSGDKDGQSNPLAASWQIGLGSVTAFSYSPTATEREAILAKFAQSPRDPQFKVTWQCGTNVVVSIDATAGNAYRNGLRFALKMGDQPEKELLQTEPGRYALSLPSPRSPMLATVSLDGHLVDRHAIPGRYAPEFDAIGNDDAALALLATRSGGMVIAPNQHTPIAFKWPIKEVRIDSYAAAAGALLVAVGLIRARLKS